MNFLALVQHVYFALVLETFHTMNVHCAEQAAAQSLNYTTTVWKFRLCDLCY